MGSHEDYAMSADDRPRIYYSQTLTIPSDKLTAYLILNVIFPSVAGQITLNIGDGAITGCSECTGGSYVKIN